MDATNSRAGAQRRDAWGNVFAGLEANQAIGAEVLNVLLLEAFNYKTFTLAHK